MKTAMEELIDWANQYEGKMISADQVVLKAYKLIEKEKEQIIGAFNYGYYCASNGTIDELELGEKEYYNQTYNQNK
jgi:hypothetical protein